MSNHFRPMRGKVFVTDLERGVRKTASGIILPDDNMTEQGIRQRWAKVAYIGEEVDDVSVGEWILLPHGRWTNRIEIAAPEGKQYVYMVDRDAILLVRDDRPDGLAETVAIPGLN